LIDCDVLVLGAGLSGGLPAATYLQKAGWRVALVERGIETGRFYQSYELLPGLCFDHSPVNFSCMSPAVLDLDLESAGYLMRLPPILHSVTTLRGEHATFYADPERTIAMLARYSTRDAARFRELMEALAPHWTRLVELLFFSPHPDRDKYREALELSAGVLGVGAAQLEQLDAVRLLEAQFESELIRLFLIPLPALNLFGDLLAPGQGALGWLWSFLLRACIAPAGNQSLARALERVFLRHGGRLLRDTEARALTFEGGACTGAEIARTGRDGERTGAERIRARRAVISNLGASLTLALMGEAAVPGAFAAKLGAWSMAKRVLAVHDFVLREMPPWKAERDNRDFARSPRIYLLWNEWRDCKAWLAQSYSDAATFHGDVELTLFDNLYPQGGGLRTLRARHGTGPFASALERERESFTEAMLDLLAVVNPELPKQIVVHQMATPLDFWRANPAALHGNPVGGDFIEGQWILDRCPYRTPIERLYLSNSVWPTALSWLAPGYNAACVVLEDLGQTRPAWWRHRPGEWIERKRARRG
jgi:phytoene dehydrogenase-like protein